MYAASLAAVDVTPLVYAIPARTVTTPWQERRGSRTKGGGPVGGDGPAGTGPQRGPDDDIISSTGPQTAQGKAGATGRHAMAEQLFAANYPKLAGWVRRLVDDDETAHEIASESFVRLMSRWTKPGNLENPQSYLYMIATNLVRDHWRKMDRERRAMHAVTSGSDLNPAFEPAQDVDVRELLKALPARLREPFLLHYYAGFGVREVAGMLKRPEGTIKADLYHARAKLKEMLETPAAAGARGAKGTRGGKANDAR
jgi:RNA polymerase sigma-70 factor (ECF subfamily)